VQAISSYIIYLPHSCHRNERPPETFEWSTWKRGWEFGSVEPHVL